MQPLPRREHQESDEELIARVASGHLSSVGLLFDRYAVDVLRFLRRLGVNDGDIDDLLQATFILVPDASASFRGGATRSWLFGLAANLARRHRRSLGKTAARIAAWTRQQYATSPPTPDDSLDRRRQVARAMGALERLSPKKREAFVMVVMEGMDAQEVAAALGVPVGTVWTRLHHARRELREALGEDCS
jgi:RNA polymerase sigma-70 factor (ECF subfamily)